MCLMRLGERAYVLEPMSWKVMSVHTLVANKYTPWLNYIIRYVGMWRYAIHGFVYLHQQSEQLLAGASVWN